MPNEVQFIKEIEKRECLYNFNLQEYNLKDVVERAWTEVARNSEMSVADCKEKWRNIRSSFVRNMKKNLLKPKKPYYLSPYLQFVLPFIKHVPIENLEEPLKNDNQISEENEVRTKTVLIKSERGIDVEENQLERVNIEVDTEFSSEDDSHSPPNESIHRRRRRPISHQDVPRNISKKKQPAATSLLCNYSRRLNNSSMRYFLLSLLPDFESMTNEQIRKFKVRVMILIDDIKRNSETEKPQKRLKRNRKVNT